MEKWNELCFVLSESVSLNSSEQLFELKIIQAFEKLGWSQFKKEISVRENIQLGSAGRITPDLIIKSEDKNLFVIEVKKPSADLNNSTFQNQLSSYMRMLRLNFGILIGNEIKIFIDGSLIGSGKLELLEKIEFARDSPSGLNFVNLFKKENFSSESIEKYIQKKILTIKENNIIENLKKKIITENSEYLISKLREKLLKEYSESIVKNVLKDIKISISDSLYLKVKESIYIQKQQRNSKKYDTNLEEQELVKIHKKIPVWFNKPTQKNSQILINYLKLKETKGHITIFELEHSCQRILNFKSSYYGMKTISERNNAKVFDEVGHIITLWKPVKEFIEKEYEKYKRKS